MFIVISDDDEGVEIGKIKMALIHNNSTVYLVAEKYHAMRLPDSGVYSLTLMQRSYCCVNQESLLDYYPLPGFTVYVTPVVILHHALPSFQNNGQFE